jgi:hypothetical protein
MSLGLADLRPACCKISLEPLYAIFVVQALCKALILLILDFLDNGVEVLG